SRVTAIKEKSASRLTLSHASAGPTTGTRDINGNNVLDFDGSEHLNFGVTNFQGVSLFAGAGREWTAVFVCETDGNGYFLGKAGADSANRQFGLLMSSGNLLSLLRGTTSNVKVGWTGNAALV